MVYIGEGKEGNADEDVEDMEGDMVLERLAEYEDGLGDGRGSGFGEDWGCMFVGRDGIARLEFVIKEDWKLLYHQVLLRFVTEPWLYMPFR